MLWRGPGGAGAASGSLGSMVASHNAGGQYLRARTTPTNPNSSFQNEVRDAIATLAPRWSSTLTQVQRDAWDVYATNVSRINKLGDSIHLSGISEFIRSNTPRIQAGLTIVDDAPTTFDSGTSPAVTFDSAANASTGTLTFISSLASVGATGSQDAALLYLSRPQNAGITFFRGPYRLAATILGSGTLTAVPFTLPFPAGPSGSQLFARMRVTRVDGRLSGDTFLSQVIA